MELEQFPNEELASLLGYARVLIGDRATAEDIVQDVVLKLLARPDLVDTVDHPRAYVRRMIMTQYVSWRRKWRRIRPTDRLRYELPESHPDVIDERDEIRRMLADLPPKQRATLVMRYYLQLGDAEIAETLGCTTGTVRTHASRGLATLRINTDSDHSSVETMSEELT